MMIGYHFDQIRRVLGAVTAYNQSMKLKSYITYLIIYLLKINTFTMFSSYLKPFLETNG